MICQISHPRSILAWQIKDTTGHAQTVGHLGSEIKKNKKDDRTISDMGQEGSQRPTRHRQVRFRQLPDIFL